MSNLALEQALRATLQASAPAEVPASLVDKAQAIATQQRAPTRSRLRLAGRASIAFAAATLTLVLGVAVVVLTRHRPPSAGAEPNPVNVASAFGALRADDLELTIGSRSFRVPDSSSAPGVEVVSLAGGTTSGQLTISWRDDGAPMTLVAFFNADSASWWVSEIVATDGRTEEAGWVYFQGPLFEQSIGHAFVGSVELSSARSTNGVQGSLRADALDLRAFVSGSPRDPSSGTMPPPGEAGAVPDFVPMVSGAEVVGYVASRQGPDSVPISSFLGQSPDQPVFAADLKTLVGYSVAGQGFVPLSAGHS